MDKKVFGFLSISSIFVLIVYTKHEIQHITRLLLLLYNPCIRSGEYSSIKD